MTTTSARLIAELEKKKKHCQGDSQTPASHFGNAHGTGVLSTPT
jgi:hypothetical protein